ncbi:hypothetical protein KVH31_34735 [Streptomyces olivaceus]|uniref:hypothetical protein n=1 Tax=Streptomyces olivaceus TaxID=47716 RepID=UPI001CD02E30|nr:hypothetical protein [Streptomyces olivaceus]MBZ6211655.1 hypothetical protein [Streptomyces olivaceus]
MDLHTTANAVPPVDGTDLGDTLEDLADIHAGIDLIRDGLRLIALARHDLTTTQVLLATLAGSPDGTDVLGAVGQLVARLSNPDSNPALRSLPLDAQKTARRHGELTAYHLGDPDLRDSTSTATAALDQ